MFSGYNVKEDVHSFRWWIKCLRVCKFTSINVELNECLVEDENNKKSIKCYGWPMGKGENPNKKWNIVYDLWTKEKHPSIPIQLMDWDELVFC